MSKVGKIAKKIIAASLVACIVASSFTGYVYAEEPADYSDTTIQEEYDSESEVIEESDAEAGTEYQTETEQESPDITGEDIKPGTDKDNVSDTDIPTIKDENTVSDSEDEDILSSDFEELERDEEYIEPGTQDEEVEEESDKVYEIPGINYDELSDAEKEFYDLAASKGLIALIYMADEVEILSDVYGEEIYRLESGYSVYPHAVLIRDGKLYYYISFFVDGEECFGYVEDYYLAYSDEEWLEWRERYYAGKHTEDENDSESIEGYEGYSGGGYYGDYSDIYLFNGTYQGALANLKAKHPNWIFVPVKTGVSLADAVKNEMGESSWIYINDINTNAGFVGSKTKQANWAYATEAGVRYYMDPRHYFDDKHIFAFEQLTYNSSYQTEATVQNFLNNTFMKGSMPGEGMTYARAFYEIGRDRKLSPTHLASRVYQEQGKGTSPLISGTYPGYEGYYNYFNVGASGGGDSTVIKNGLEYAKKMGWNTRYKSIAGGAATIGNNYILKGQDTIYLEKFNVGVGSSYAKYQHQYMQNIQAPYSEAVTTYNMYNNSGAINSTFVFKIPVYTDIDIDFTDNVDVEKHIESVEILDKDLYAELNLGETVTLGKIYTPSDTTDSIAAVWTSSNPKVATVEDGIVTAVGKGKTVIKVTMGEKNIYDNISITVSACTVKFMKADRMTQAKSMDVEYGYILAEDDFPLASALGQTDSSQEFEGWYALDGKIYKPGDVINDAEVTLMPYYESVGKGFYAVAVGDQEYTGKVIKPEIVVYDSNTYKDENDDTQVYHKQLIEGKDYTLTYKNNKIPGSADNTNANLRPMAIIRGKGDYQGTQYVYFNIVQRSLRSSGITADPITVMGNGKVNKVIPAVYDNGTKLKPGFDYTISYPAVGDGSYQRNGVWPIKLIGKGGYSGSFTVYETITSDLLLSGAAIGRAASVVYDESVIDRAKGIGMEPKILVMYGETVLTDAKDAPKGSSGDYTVTYSENMSVGTGKITITAVKGSGYAGSKTVTFKITGVSMNKVKVYGIENKSYNLNSDKMLQSGYTLKYGDKILTESTDGINGDYTVSYLRNTAVGTAYILFTGINGYSGNLKCPYEILSLNLTDKSSVTGKLLTEVSMSDTYYYQKGGVKPKPAVSYNGIELIEGRDYSISYLYNKSVAGVDDRKAPMLTIRGRGDYSGSINVKFNIIKCDLSLLSDRITAQDVAYSTRKNGFKSVPTVTDLSGQKLIAGKDYSSDIKYYYADDADLDKDGIKDRRTGDEVMPTDIVPSGTRIEVVVRGKDSSKEYYGEAISCIYRISDVSLTDNKVKSQVNAQFYTGRQICPGYDEIKLTYKNNTILTEDDYTIVSYTNNINKGTGKITIKGKGNYCGTRVITFSIKAKGILWWK